MVPMAMRPRTATPPTTPPTIAPTGTGLEGESGTSDELVGPGSVVVVGSLLIGGIVLDSGIDIVVSSSMFMVEVVKSGLSSPLKVCSTL
jgi:hypothetical protein